MKERFPGLLWLKLALGYALILAGCSGGIAPAAQAADFTSPSVPNDAVTAEGRVIPMKEAVLSYSISGVVSEVFVAEGDAVQAGQVLARLSGIEQLQTAVSAAAFEVLLAEQELDTLLENSDLDKAQAELAVISAKQALEKADKRLLSREYQRGGAEQVDIARANYVLAEDGVTQAASFYDQVDDRADDDPDRAHALSQLAAARQKRDQSLGNLNYLLSKPNELDVAQINAEVELARAQLSAAEQRRSELQTGPAADRMALAEAKRKNAQARLSAAQTSQLDLELKAPFSGVVGPVMMSVGEFITAGAPALRLSDPSTWLVETTDLSELDIARIQSGMPASIEFDALADYSVIARVDQIGSFGETSQGDIVYAVRLQLEQPDPRLRWNMTAIVTFIETLDE